jgi:hypothetical protein
LATPVFTLTPALAAVSCGLDGGAGLVQRDVAEVVGGFLDVFDGPREGGRHTVSIAHLTLLGASVDVMHHIAQANVWIR